MCRAREAPPFFLLRSFSIFFRMAYTFNQQRRAYHVADFHTSSRFDCFCLLALSVEVPLSLCMAELAYDSSLGRGILEGLFSKTGTCPLPWPRPGVPRNVPPAADMFIYEQLGTLEWSGLANRTNSSAALLLKLTNKHREIDQKQPVSRYSSSG